jgi:hypothetical protein
MTIEEIQGLAAKVASSKSTRVAADSESDAADAVAAQKAAAAEEANLLEDEDIEALKSAVAEYVKELAV